MPLISRWLERDEIIVISGPRRVGKTTVLTLLRDELLARGISESQVFLLNLEDLDILKELSTSPKALLKYIVNRGDKNYFLIDEIQYLPEPTNFLKYLYDLHRDSVKLIVTGSFLLEMKGQFRDALVGRKVSFNLTPLTFDEFVRFTDDQLVPYLTKEDLPEAIRADFIRLLDDYLVYGGMPEIVLTSDRQMKQILLKEYVNTYLRKDIRYISGSEDILRYNDLLAVIANQTSGLLNVSEVSNTLGLPRKKVEKYLQTLILSGLVYVIPPYFSNVRTQISKMKKVFLFDPGIRNQLVLNFNDPAVRNDAGALFESFILNELVNVVGKEYVYYFRTKAGTEIDFVLRANGLVPIEVKYKRLNRLTGLRPLRHFVAQQTATRAYLVNLTLNQRVEGSIEVLDFLRFLNRIREIHQPV